MVAIRTTQLARILSTIIQISPVVGLRFILKTSLLPRFIATLHISQMRPLWRITQVPLIVVLMVIVIFTLSLSVGLVTQLVMLLKKLNYHQLLNQGTILVMTVRLRMAIMKSRLQSINLNILM